MTNRQLVLVFSRDLEECELKGRAASRKPLLKLTSVGYNLEQFEKRVAHHGNVGVNIIIYGYFYVIIYVYAFTYKVLVLAKPVLKAKIPRVFGGDSNYSIASSTHSLLRLMY